ncbi:hypothetical protein MVEN_00429500 [Mycena venus]|uniref:Uncharacterized protein n=1 Tax=Mycena venus TaxID=2733690 RepID=A0A8H7DAG5_9AGAR|nr:hypothetical protein MVEN_00429500 [Mycena venus]
MKFTSALLSTVLVVSVSAVPVQKRGVDPNLVPDFGIVAGTNPTGTGDCDGVNGIKIPCACPPSRDSFIAALSADVAAGHDVNNPGVAAPFPTDDSTASKIIRLQTSVTTLQNLHAAGVGCPASSTTFLAQIKALQDGTAAPAPAPAPAPASAPAPAAPAGFDASLVPEFGVSAGVNPTGTGDCDGINGIKIPCACPPSRDAFIAQVAANVAAGHDVHNPAVAAPLPDRRLEAVADHSDPNCNLVAPEPEWPRCRLPRRVDHILRAAQGPHRVSDGLGGYLVGAERYLKLLQGWRTR